MNDLMTKSFLNYVDLKKQAQLDLETEVSSLEEACQHQLNPIDQENLSSFFHEVEEIKSQMEQISNLLHELESLNEETKSTHSAKVLRGLRDRMDSNTISILKKMKVLKARLECLHKSNLNNRRISYAFAEGSTVDRTRISVTNGLRIRLGDMLNDFTSLREKIMSDHKEELKRKYFNATGEVPSEETVDKMVSGSIKVKVFEAGNNVDVVGNKERHEAVVDIQRSLNKLHQVFLDMAMLVETQGEQIDDIEKNVAYAGEFISGGTDGLHYAKQMKKKNKKWVYWVWFVGFVILLVCFIATLSH